MVSGYWGAPNALKDYCEANYVVSYYFAEFFNSISSIPFFIQAVIGCYLTHKYATKEFRFKLCYFSLMFVGFGSFLFHATLQYRFQLLDAIPMLFCATAVNYCACTLHLPLGHTDWKLAIKFIIVLVVELIFYLGLKIWMIFILGFGLNIVSITYVMSRDHRDVIGVYWIYAVLLYYGGFMCWIIDQCLCDYVQRLHLHSVWHVCAGYGSYLSLLTVVIARAKYLKKQNNVYLYTARDLMGCDKEFKFGEEVIGIDIPLVHYCYFTEMESKRE